MKVKFIREDGEDRYIYNDDGSVEYEWIQPPDYIPPTTQELTEIVHFTDIDCLQTLFNF